MMRAEHCETAGSENSERVKLNCPDKEDEQEEEGEEEQEEEQESQSCGSGSFI